MTSPSPFDQLLMAAAAQPEPQRLLFVFTGAELPEDASPAQRARFDAGQGGALAPLACVDKELHELSTFEALVAEARQATPAWKVVFIAGLSGEAGQPPSNERVDSALGRMVEGVRTGRLHDYLALDPQGEPVIFS
jgi:hypothetical protein